MVSMRVVKTQIFSDEFLIANSASAPCERPIQFFCIDVTRSGHAVRSVSIASKSASEYLVIRNAHSGISLSTTCESQRSQRASFTCSLAITVMQPVHQFTFEKRR